MKRPQLKSFRDRNPVTVGLVAAVVVGALVAGALAVGTLGLLEDRYQLRATFERTGGLGASADVRLAGVPVGVVTDIDPDYQRGHVVVTFEIDRGIDLGPETTAEIVAATLLGGYYVRLDGPVTEPHLEDLGPDDPRRHVPLERTQGPVSLNQVLDETTGVVSGIDVDAANRVLEQLAGAANRNVDQLPELIDSFTTVASAIAERDSELRRLSSSAAQLTGTLAARDQQLAALLDTSQRLLAELAARRDELSTILDQGTGAASEMASLLTTRRAAIDRLITDIATVSNELADTLPFTNRTLTQARTIFPLLVNTLTPEGGFNVRGEGLVVHPAQLENVIDVVEDLLDSLGIAP
jgi:phospholipid/cholesterol/gamma-HCH transport system substrate-binding protein